MRARLRRRGPLAVLVALTTLVGLTVVPAYAARLSLTGSGARPFATTQARCTNGPLTVSPSGTATAGQYTSVTVSGITGSTCTTGRVIVHGSTSPGTIRFNGTGTVSGTTMTATSTAFTPPASNAASVYVTLNGWIVPATWTFTPPVSPTGCRVVRLNPGGVEVTSPGATCTVTGVAMQAGGWWGTKPARQTNLDVSFTSTGAVYPDYFVFTVNLSTVPGLPTDWTWSTSGSGNGNPTVRSACSALPLLTASSPTTWGPPTAQFFPLYENRAGNAVSCS